MKKIKLLTFAMLSFFIFSCSSDDSIKNEDAFLPGDEYTFGTWEEWFYRFDYNGSVYEKEGFRGNWKDQLTIEKGVFKVSNYTGGEYIFSYIAKKNKYNTYDFFDKNNVTEKPIAEVFDYEEDDELLAIKYNFSVLPERMKEVLFNEKKIAEDATGIIITYSKKLKQ